MKNLTLLASALLATTPFAVLLSGCGGSSGGLFSTPTPSPTATVTPQPTATGSATPTPTQSAQQTSNLTLGNGQRAVLRYTTSGTKINGSLQILATSPNDIGARAITYTFAVGTYTITGMFTPPRGYNITGTSNGQPLFTMTGQLPTTTQTGSYTLTVNGQTESGTIPRIGTITPTATPHPTATTSPSGAVKTNLTFVKSSGSNFVNVPLTIPKLSFTPAGGVNVLGFGGQGYNTSTRDTLGFFTVILGAKAGQVTTFDASQTSNYLISVPNGLLSNYFFARSGTITVTAFTSSTATLTYKNVVYVANQGGNGKGSVTVNGTVSGPYTTN